MAPVLEVFFLILLLVIGFGGLMMTLATIMDIYIAVDDWLDYQKYGQLAKMLAGPVLLVGVIGIFLWVVK